MFDGLLIHRVEVLRRLELTDPFGQPTRDSQLAGSYPCRLTIAHGGRRQGETMTERSRDVIRAEHTIFVRPSADVREDDEVTVTDAAGNVILDTANVVLVRRLFDGSRANHLEINVDVIRGSGGG